jgi:hypothetical protein
VEEAPEETLHNETGIQGILRFPNTDKAFRDALRKAFLFLGQLTLIHSSKREPTNRKEANK